MKNNYLHIKYYTYKAKRDFHSRIDEILTTYIDSEADQTARKKLCSRRSHHRKLYRKYEAKAQYMLGQIRTNIWAS